MIHDPVKMPKTPIIVFDLGKVLVDFDYTIAARRISMKSRQPVDIGQFFTAHAPLLFSYELGRISTQQFFEAMRQATGYAGTPDEFGESFADIFTEIPAMTALHARLRQSGFSTYIFSNTNELAVSHIRRRFPFFANFDGYLYSYEQGVMKPDDRFYEVVERETKGRAQEIVYIDDRPENIAAGTARGWHSVLHELPDKTQAVLEKLKVLNPA
jgi:HAD superfamily hydrolase (TIGR01509 family)